MKSRLKERFNLAREINRMMITQEKRYVVLTMMLKHGKIKYD